MDSQDLSLQPRNWTLAVAYGLAVLTFAWAMSNVPLIATPYGTYDDALFVRGAINFLSGRWLGPYDNMTLAKGPVYPIWVAMAWMSGLPLLVAQGLAYALALVVLVRGLRPWLWSEPSAYFLFLILLFNPATYAIGQLRVMREGLYVPLTIFILALLVWWMRWRTQPLAHRALAAVVTGLVIGCYWCTREEGLWILPAVGAALLRAADLNLRPVLAHVRTSKPARRLLAAEAGLLALIAASACGVTLGFGLINSRYYGVADVVELKQSEFLSAYGSLARIKVPAGPKHHVVISHTGLEKAFDNSPALAELRPYFSGEGGRDWVNASCEYYQVSPCDGDIRARDFVWALRDAVATVGRHASATEARAYYARVGAELAAACDGGRLDCLPPRRTMAPPFRFEFVGGTLREAKNGLAYILSLHVMDLVPAPMSCYIDDCGYDGRTWSLFLDVLNTNLFVPTPWIPPPVDLLRRSGNPADALPFERRGAYVYAALGKVVAAYRALLPVLFTTSVLAYLLLGIYSLVIRRADPLFVIATLAGMVAACRIVLMAYIEASSLPAINSLYLSPIYPAVLLFVFVANLGVVRLLADAPWRTAIARLRGA